MAKTPLIPGALQRLGSASTPLPVLFGLLGLFLVLRSLIPFLYPPHLSANDLTRENILAAVNYQRSLRNLPALSQNSKLAWAAQYKSEDMMARHYFSHTDPEGHYIWDKIAEAGYTPYLQLGENLAIEFYDTDNLVSAWMESPTHRANILQEGFKDQGMGMALGNASSGQYYSAIANTFGTLAVIKQPVAPPVQTPVQKPAETPAQNEPQKPAPVKADPEPAAQASPPKETATHIPLPVRGFSSEPSVSSSTEPTVPEELPLTAAGTVTAPEAAGSPAGPSRLLSLIFGGFLLLLLGRDIFLIRRSGQRLDKKAGNLALLVLSLIVVAALYFL